MRKTKEKKDVRKLRAWLMLTDEEAQKIQKIVRKGQYKSFSEMIRKEYLNSSE
jgi:hypothetical protein